MGGMKLTRRALVIAAVVVAWLVLAPTADADDQLAWSGAMPPERQEAASQ